MNQNNIFFELINTKNNEEMLKNLPHREFLDLSVIYREKIGEKEGNIITRKITEEMAEKEGLTEQKLFNLAYTNTARLFPVDFMSLGYMRVMTNPPGLYGAANMLYPDYIQKLAEEVDGDLYILPSSIHEVIAIEAIGDPEALIAMVREVNAGVVDPKDQLSDNVYYYNKKSKTISVITE